LDRTERAATVPSQNCRIGCHQVLQRRSLLRYRRNSEESPLNSQVPHRFWRLASFMIFPRSLFCLQTNQWLNSSWIKATEAHKCKSKRIVLAAKLTLLKINKRQRSHSGPVASSLATRACSKRPWKRWSTSRWKDTKSGC